MSKLSNTQKIIFHEFIESFLPKRNDKRKNSTNEILYLRTVLNTVFNKYFNFNLTDSNILEAFLERGYDVSTKKGVWNAEDKIERPSKKGKLIRLDKELERYNASFIYVNLQQPVVRILKRSVSGLPPHTNEKKKVEVEDMKKRLQLFAEKFRIEV